MHYTRPIQTLQEPTGSGKTQIKAVKQSQKAGQ